MEVGAETVANGSISEMSESERWLRKRSVSIVSTSFRSWVVSLTGDMNETGRYVHVVIDKSMSNAAANDALLCDYIHT